MTFNYESEVEDELDFDMKNLYELVVNTVLDNQKCPYEAEVNLLITDNGGIHEMNKNFRNIDSATDVLSFPMVQYTKAADFSYVEDDDDNFNPETGELLLGDIVINIDRIHSQAKEYGHSEKREYAFLICHSMLHLIGYDHIDETDRVLMEEKQSMIMELLKITR